MRETQPRAPSGTSPNQMPRPSAAAKASRVGQNGRDGRDAQDGARDRGEPTPTPRETRRCPSPAQFDLVVTFEDDQPAREALLALRRERFGPDQAVLLTRGPLHPGEFELAEDALRTESYIALGIVIATELAMGALLGGVIGWIAGLFHFAPAVGPVWQPILIVGGIGLLSACVVAALDIRRWRRVHLPTPGAAAVALRLRGRDAPERLARAQQVLARFGGQQETG